MVAAYVHEHERVAVFLEVERELLGRGGLGVGEAHVCEAAERFRELVEQAAGLAEVVVLRALRHLGECHGVDGVALPERFHGTAEGELDGGG